VEAQFALFQEQEGGARRSLQPVLRRLRRSLSR
jgi:hypothetical protein